MNIEALRWEVKFTAVTSRGPGGQNVNKVSSAAHLAWNVEASALLTGEQKMLVLMKLKNKINNEGDLIVRSDEFRDLPRNKERGLQKLYGLICQAIHVQKPRRATKPTKSSQRKRLAGKTYRARTKKSRQKVSSDD